MHNDGAFPFLDEPKVEQLYREIVGREPTHAQHMWMRNNCNDPWLTNGVMAFQWPWKSGAPMLLVYTCCHGAQLCKYWLEFSRTGYVRNHFNLVYVSNYRVKGDAHYELGNVPKTIDNLPEEYRELFLAVWRRAEIIVTHPAYGGTEFTPDNLISYSNAAYRMFQFHSPSFGALWPVCLFGDEWVRRLLRSGTPAEEIKEMLANRTTHCDLPVRFRDAVTRLQRKDDAVDVRISEFFQQWYRWHRMFITVNHPSFRLMGYQALQLERMIEQSRSDAPMLGHDDLDHVLSLPWNACNFQPVWPDHKLTHDLLSLQYPMDYPDLDGHYDREIDRCAREIAHPQTDRPPWL